MQSGCLVVGQGSVEGSVTAGSRGACPVVSGPEGPAQGGLVPL